MSNERSVLDQIRFSRGLSLWQAMSRGLGVMVSLILFIRCWRRRSLPILAGGIALLSPGFIAWASFFLR